MKGVQCYELFGGIAHKNHAFFIDKKWSDDIVQSSMFDQILRCVH